MDIRTYPLEDLLLGGGLNERKITRHHRGHRYGLDLDALAVNVIVSPLDIRLGARLAMGDPSRDGVHHKCNHDKNTVERSLVCLEAFTDSHSTRDAKNGRTW